MDQKLDYHQSGEESKFFCPELKNVTIQEPITKEME